MYHMTMGSFVYVRKSICYCRMIVALHVSLLASRRASVGLSDALAREDESFASEHRCYRRSSRHWDLRDIKELAY